MMMAAHEMAPRVLRQLAEERNVELLDLLVISPAVNARCQHKASMVWALAPLMNPSGDSPARTDLVVKWLKALDVDTPAKLGALLPDVLLSEARILLDTFGADPLAPVVLPTDRSVEGCTALGRVTLSWETQKLAVMLAKLIEQGRDPVTFQAEGVTRSLFDTIAAREANRADKKQQGDDVKISQIMAEMDLPIGWQRQAGASLSRYLDEKGTIDHRTDIAMLAMMGIARFDNANEWLRVLRSSNTPAGIPWRLLDQDQEPLALRIIENMRRDGVDMDEIEVAFFADGKMQAMPWLHAAASSDRPPIVNALLEAGCNYGIARHTLTPPNTTIGKVVERDALDVTSDNTTSYQMITAWKAKQAISDVLHKATSGKDVL
jgi:hypothetical protein